MSRLMKYLAAQAGIPVGLYSISGMEAVEATDIKGLFQLCFIDGAFIDNIKYLVIFYYCLQY